MKLLKNGKPMKPKEPTIENTFLLNLTNDKAIHILSNWSNQLLQHEKHIVKINFDESIDLGNGSITHHAHSITHNIIVGIGPFDFSDSMKNDSMSDQTFIRICDTMFHEIAHYKQFVSKDTDREILISDLSKAGNPDYYGAMWHKKPHEIDAEWTGVLSTWEYLEEYYPKHADKLMCAFLSYKANNTIYPIKEPEGGFQSKEQADTLFEETYEKSVHEKQEFPEDHQRFDDEVIKMFLNEDGSLNQLYAPFDNALIKAKTGRELDLMMASLVAYLHPELQDLYENLDFKDLDPEHIFGLKMPETREEIIKRVNTSKMDSVINEDDFTKAVESIPMDEAGLTV